MQEFIDCQDCDRLDAAYGACRANVNGQTYTSVVKALEEELRDGRFAFTPVAPESADELFSKGQLVWDTNETPYGILLSVYSSEGHVQQHIAEQFVRIRIDSFFDMLLDNEQIAGFSINPCDDVGGIRIPREYVETAALKSGRLY